MNMRAVQVPRGRTCCALAVRSDSPESGVVTLRRERQSWAAITETAAPVSTRAKVETPSTDIATTLAGEVRGLEHFDDGAVLASGTAAFSFPGWRKRV